MFAITVAPAGGAGTLPLPDPEPLPEPDPEPPLLEPNPDEPDPEVPDADEPDEPEEEPDDEDPEDEDPDDEPDPEVPLEVEEEPDDVPEEALEEPVEVDAPDVADDPEELLAELEEVSEEGVAGALEGLGITATAGLADAVIVVFVPPHPVIAKAAMARIPIAPNPFRFNCIRGPFRRWGSRQSGQVRGASTLDVYGELPKRIKELTLERTG